MTPLRNVVTSWWVEAPVEITSTVLRAGANLGSAAVSRTVAVPWQLTEAATQLARTATREVTDASGRLLGDLGALTAPRTRRSHRHVETGSDRATFEVRGLSSAPSPGLVRAVEQQLDRLGSVRWSRVNAITGRVVAGLRDVEAELPQVLAAVAQVEERAEVADQDWDPTIEHPADREPILAAGIQVAADLTAVVVAAAGSLLPGGGPLPVLRTLAMLADNQPRVRRELEARLGRPRTDLLLTLITALGNAASANVATLVLDGAQRGLQLAEAGANHALWQEWESEFAHRAQQSVREPLPDLERPAPLPAGPVERVADETGIAGMAGAVGFLGRGRFADAMQALELGAPKTARAGREAYAATTSALLARAGVLTLHPAVWRRLDRLDVLVVDGAALLTSASVVLEVEPAAEQRAGAIWSAAQRLLWGTEDSGGLRLERTDGGESGRPGWYELREQDRPLGRVLIGRETDGRAQSLLESARSAGLRVILSADRDAAELRSFADEFVDAEISLSELVAELQQDGRMVGVFSADGYKALDRADVGIGLARTDGDEVSFPWSADVVCRELAGVQRVLAAVAPARQISERGRVLALSAGALGGLLLTTTPARNTSAPLITTNVAGLLGGVLSGWSTSRAELSGAATSPLPWHALEPGEVLARLPEPPAQDRLTDEDRSRTKLLDPVRPMLDFTQQLRRELADPLTPLLGVGAIATAILGSASDAILLSSVLTVNGLVSARQRQQAERALHRLLEHEQVTARLLDRSALDDGNADETTIPARCLMVGDAIALRQGDIVPADARLVRTADLELDESGLTGESVTVAKRVAATPGAALTERACMVYEGTTVVNGHAHAVVVAVGANTRAGRAAAGAVPPEKGGVQAQLRKLTDRALPLTLTGGAVVTLLGSLRGRVLREAIADGVAVAVAAVPEGLPLVATVAQLAAARRLSKHGVLVRANRTVEALGRVDTLCFDKTGTLTEGKLRLTTVADLDGQWPSDADSTTTRRLLRAAARACPDPEEGPIHHATDRAVLEAMAEFLGADAHRWDPIDELPFDSNRGYAAALGHTAKKLRLFVKGAPEVVLPRCSKYRAAQGDRHELDEQLRDRAQQVVHELAEQGLRVLVIARRDLSDDLDTVEDAMGELTLLGFIGLADTPRRHTLALVKALQDNGIDIRMITGDHPVTATAIARQLGIAADRVVTGADLDGLDETAQTELIARSGVFARVNPEQKVRIVAALRRTGRVVGMTGDGSNDAAAIRTADVGIGMAAHGSVAARNAADLVLTRPEPTALLDALIEGRNMWRRVIDAVGVLVGGNAGEVAFTMFGTAVTGRAPLGTRQFLLVNMLTDMFPALALALSRDTDSAQSDRATALADTAPAHLGDDLLRTLAVRGIATAGGAATAWTIARYTGTERRAATVGLVALIGTQLGQTLLSARRSPLVWVTTAASGAVLGAVVMTPGLCTYFGCRPLGPVGWTIALTCAAVATAGAALVPVSQQESSSGSSPGSVPLP